MNPQAPIPMPEKLRKALGRTLGVPLFQEQVMALLQVAAGFTAGEADQLRRSMAAWKRNGGLEHFQERIFGGLMANGYEREYAERVFEQIKGFGSYGFPESHAAAFAQLVYVSSWLKHSHPDAFDGPTFTIRHIQEGGEVLKGILPLQKRQRHLLDVPPQVGSSLLLFCVAVQPEPATPLRVDRRGNGAGPGL